MLFTENKMRRSSENTERKAQADVKKWAYVKKKEGLGLRKEDGNYTEKEPMQYRHWLMKQMRKPMKISDKCWFCKGKTEKGRCKEEVCKGGHSRGGGSVTQWCYEEEDEGVISTEDKEKRAYGQKNEGKNETKLSKN